MKGKGSKTGVHRHTTHGEAGVHKDSPAQRGVVVLVGILVDAESHRGSRNPHPRRRAEA